MKGHILTLAVFVAFSFGCNDGIRRNPIMPSSSFEGSEGNGPTANQADLSMWSPYIVVHTPGEATMAYQKAIPELMASGALKGVRISITKGEDKNSVNEWIASTNLDILWILDNYYLFDPNIEQVIDQAVAWYPGIRYLQIGNEITTILPRPGPQVSVEMYMDILRKIYTYVQIKYPGIILVTQSTFGSGNHGSLELERMVELGLREMSPNRLIVGMNIYSLQTAYNYSHVINRLGLRKDGQSYRIWVTETGASDPDEHIQYVQSVYPFLSNVIRAERIYWYCLYCGESGYEAGSGLIKEISSPLFWTSPLYDFLARRK